VLIEGPSASADTFYYLLQELYTVTGLVEKSGALAEADVYDGYGKVRIWDCRMGVHDRDGNARKPAPRILACLFVAALLVGCSRSSSTDASSPSPNGSPPAKSVTSRAGEGLRFCGGEVSKTVGDLAEVNLRSATGLSGSEELRASALLSTLDAWAERVKAETQRHLHRFNENPQLYENSEAYFRVLMMIVVLQEDFGVRYNPERIMSPDYTDSRDLFIHGLLTGHGGTCVSMPVLYVAIGRKLGYPLALVLAKAHVFARWEDRKTGERFNIEATNRGLNTFPDEYYEQWPEQMSPEDREAAYLLTSMTPHQEEAFCLAIRSHCLLDTGRTVEAVGALTRAVELWPENEAYRYFLEDAERRLALSDPPQTERTGP